MPTFPLGKSIDDIVEPELMPKDWYPFVIYKEPTREPNKVMSTEGPKADKAGHNVIVDLRCIDEGEHKGRVFRVWLGLPSVGDKEKRSSVTGETFEDMKVVRNAKFARDFGGTVEGDQFSLSLGGTGMLYVTQQMDQNQTQMINSIDIFAGSRSIGTGEEDEGEVPFDM